MLARSMENWIVARVTDMRVLGTTMGQKTWPAGRAGLWASDHAGVAAKLQFD